LHFQWLTEASGEKRRRGDGPIFQPSGSEQADEKNHDIPPSTDAALITGANSDIGYETALEVARHGAEVILLTGSIEKANDAIARIRREVPHGF
jgi:hypothetical protein